ncbi:MAG TPA: glycosyltransferase family 2 protein [Myxococcota bacterium]|jgi:glycosyltransferase involved in cell wall biosynthesis
MRDAHSPSPVIAPAVPGSSPVSGDRAAAALPSLATIILTFNEEDNVGPAIESVHRLAREIFVVDSFSTDRTVDVAERYRGVGVQVVQHEFENYSAQWDWALHNLPIRSEWILKLDADERVTPEFEAEVTRVLAHAADDLGGVYFRRRLIFMGRPLRWGGMAGFDLRLWRRGRGRFDGRAVNEHVIVDGRSIRLSSCVEHHDTKSLSDWWDKHNRYSSFEALNLIERSPSGAVRPSLFGNPEAQRMWIRERFFSHSLRFLASAALFSYHFFARLGFLDGTRGFQAAFLRASFFYMIQLKVLEYRRTGKVPTVSWPVRGAPHPNLADPGRRER